MAAGGLRKVMRGVFERPAGSGIFWINYYDQDGRRHREKIGRESIAIEAYLHRRAQVREGKFRKPRERGMLFRELAQLAIEDKKRHRARGTWEKDLERIVAVNQAIGELPVMRISTAVVERMLEDLSAKGLAPATVNRHRSLVSGVLSFGMRRGLILKNVAQHARRLKEPAGRLRFLSADEEAALRLKLKLKSLAYEAEFDLALNTGIRRGEQYALRWQDVDLEKKIITVSGKTGRRHVRLNDRARAALGTLWNHATGSAFVSVAPSRGEREKRDHPDWRKWFEAAVKEAKIDDFCWHDLRHTFASRLVMAGVEIATVSKLLGHRTIQMTMRYAHLAPGHEQAAVDRLVDAAAEGMGTQMALAFRNGR